MVLRRQVRWHWDRPRTAGKMGADIIDRIDRIGLVPLSVVSVGGAHAQKWRERKDRALDRVKEWGDVGSSAWYVTRREVAVAMQ